MDDISAEVEDEKNVDVICRLVSYGGKKTLCVEMVKQLKMIKTVNN